MDKFRYQVTPFTPINNLIKGKSLRRPFSSDLTKEEVFICMKHGPVYRILPGQTPIRVTGSNIDQLHTDPTAKNKEEVSNDTTNAEINEIEQPVVTESPINEASTEEIKEELTESEEYTVNEEESIEVEDSEEVVVDDIEESEELVEYESEDDEEEMIPLTQVNQNSNQPQFKNYNNYNKKKKRHN